MKHQRPRQLEGCHNIYDLQLLARRRLPYPLFHFLDGGAEDELTLEENTATLDRLKLIPRYLVDVTSVKTRTRILGQDLEWPVFCAPTGGSRFFHSEGELAVARAAAKSGTLYGLSTMATYSLEEVAAASQGPKLYQLYIFRNRDVTRDMIARCKRAGYSSLCLTVDGPVPGKRERDLRSGWGITIKLSLRSTIDFVLHPRWLLGLWRGGKLSMPNVAAQCGSDSIAAQMAFIGQQLDPAVTWRDLREFVELWGGPFAIKGLLSPEDVQRAIDIGASAVILSNHGGRQLDGAVSPIEVLPGISTRFGDQIEIILDGGVRRGSHVLKALALGAKACSVGRPYLFGLSAGGEVGVTKALDILRSEFVRAMKLTGCADVAQVNETLLHRV